ncbi:MAG: PadR family transcriptional regulator, partial [Nocardioides sp.]
MPIHHAVLALLHRGPSYGYQLKSEFEAAVGPQWGALNIGHLYQLLDRLSRDGLAVTRRDPQPARPDRLVYAITEAGDIELRRWLVAEEARPHGYRDDLFLKIMAAGRLGDRETLELILSRENARLLQELRDLAAVPL